jgi:hypothetical protein
VAADASDADAKNCAYNNADDEWDNENVASDDDEEDDADVEVVTGTDDVNIGDNDGDRNAIGTNDAGEAGNGFNDWTATTTGCCCRFLATAARFFGAAAVVEDEEEEPEEGRAGLLLDFEVTEEDVDTELLVERVRFCAVVVDASLRFRRLAALVAAVPPGGDDEEEREAFVGDKAGVVGVEPGVAEDDGVDGNKGTTGANDAGEGGGVRSTGKRGNGGGGKNTGTAGNKRGEERGPLVTLAGNGNGFDAVVDEDADDNVDLGKEMDDGNNAIDWVSDGRRRKRLSQYSGQRVELFKKKSLRMF